MSDVAETKLASLRVDNAAQPIALPPKTYPFYVIPPYQCSECESGVKWEMQKLEPNPTTGVGFAIGSCLSGTIGVACSRAGKRYRVPLLVAWASEEPAQPTTVEQETSEAPSIVDQPAPKKRKRSARKAG